jgi:AcrR family transcriptional regulator
MGYAGAVREWIPVPGSAKARLLAAAIARFETDGFEGAAVTAIASDAGTTTGALYHHFGSKHGIFAAIREEMERRVRDRMEGAHAAVGGGRAGLVAALLVGFDAAVHFGAARILSEPGAAHERDVLLPTLTALVGEAPTAAPALLLGTYRAALAAVAGGVPASEARSALAWTLGTPPDTTGRRDR